MHADTDTRIDRSPETVDRLHRIARRHNQGGSHYVARHSVENPPVPMTPLPRHVRTEVIAMVPPEQTVRRRIDVGNLRVQVPLATRPPVPPPMVPPVEPVAEVTLGLLERVLRRLRGMK